MARIRSVHPGICESEDLVEVPAEVERTFVRLWTHCDDEGRAKDNPRLIKAAIYPLLDEMTAEAVDAHLAELAARGLIVRYEAEGVRYLAVASWGKYQHPQKKRDSTLPPPPGPGPVEVPDESRSATRQVADESGPVVGVVVGEGEGEVTPPSPPSTSSAAVVDEPSPTATDDVKTVFDAWIEATGRTGRTLLDSKRRRLIANALKRYPLNDVLDAVRGWRNSPHHRGENGQGTTYNDLELLLRDPAHVERFRDLWRSPPRAPRPNGSQPSALGIVRQIAERQGVGRATG